MQKTLDGGTEEEPGLQNHRSKLFFLKGSKLLCWDREKKKKTKQNAQAGVKRGLWQKLLTLERCWVKKRWAEKNGLLLAYGKTADRDCVEGSKLTWQRQHTIFIGSNQHGQALGAGADICVGCHSDPVLSPFFQLFQKVFGSVRRNSQNLVSFVIFSIHCSILDGVFSNNAILFFHWWRLPTYQNASGTWAGTTNVLRRSWRLLFW